jgi:hypothetical protein
MKCDKYMGMDVHQAMTVVVVLDADGKVILETMVPTEAAAIIRLVRSLSGPLRVTFEESTQAAWLYEVIRSLCDRSDRLRSTTQQAVGRRFKSGQSGCAKTGRASSGWVIALGLSRT